MGWCTKCTVWHMKSEVFDLCVKCRNRELHYNVKCRMWSIVCRLAYIKNLKDYEEPNVQVWLVVKIKFCSPQINSLCSVLEQTLSRTKTEMVFDAIYDSRSWTKSYYSEITFCSFESNHFKWTLILTFFFSKHYEMSG